jgi:hypothetical protein
VRRPKDVVRMSGLGELRLRADGVLVLLHRRMSASTGGTCDMLFDDRCLTGEL